MCINARIPEQWKEAYLVKQGSSVPITDHTLVPITQLITIIMWGGDRVRKLKRARIESCDNRPSDNTIWRG